VADQGEGRAVCGREVLGRTQLRPRSPHCRPPFDSGAQQRRPGRRSPVQVPSRWPVRMGLRRTQGWRPPGRSRLRAGRAAWAQLEGPRATTRAFDVLVDNDAMRTALDAIFGPGPVAPA
jgi:hypothetical protein